MTRPTLLLHVVIKKVLTYWDVTMNIGESITPSKIRAFYVIPRVKWAVAL